MGVKLVDRTAQVKAALREQIAHGLNEAGQFWVHEAQAAANVDTGFMKAHIMMPESEMAIPARLSTTVRSLARYSVPQDTGVHGNLFWTRAYLATRAKFKQFLYGKGGHVGGSIIRAAEEEFHGPLGRKGGGF